MRGQLLHEFHQNIDSLFLNQAANEQRDPRQLRELQVFARSFALQQRRRSKAIGIYSVWDDAALRAASVRQQPREFFGRVCAAEDDMCGTTEHGAPKSVVSKMLNTI
jgi:hypothetical protein